MRGRISGISLYIISTAGFQSGALTAAELTNIRLVTWSEFQAEFEQSWITHHFCPTLDGRLDTLWRYTEPIPPYSLLDRLDESAQRAFIGLRETHQPFWSALFTRSEEHTSELQSLRHLVCRL